MFVRREVEERDVERGVNSSTPVGFPSEIEKADHIDGDDDDNIINDDPFVGRQEPFPLVPTQASPPCPSSFPFLHFCDPHFFWFMNSTLNMVHPPV